MGTAWRYLVRSVQGQSHAAENTPCQDGSRVRELDGRAAGTLVACVADGAGSARHSDVGSLAACNAVMECVDAYLAGANSVTTIDLQRVIEWCDAARRRIEEEAAVRAAKPTDFATTLGVAILAPDGSCFFQIGDGAIVLQQHGALGVVFWPESGEYINTTTFLTSKEYRDRLQVHTTAATFSEAALFTDGIERIALQFNTRTPHPPFFTPLFRALRDTPRWQGLGDNLEQFLRSEPVCSRSDDDKTLILVTRIDE